jgi:signal transduction histidine kinase
LTPLGLNWESPRNAPITPRAPTVDIRVIITVVYGAIVLTVTLALLLLRHQRQVLARYQEVDDAIADRTQQLAATERELLHSQKMRALGTLAAGIAHDFNNLLSVIRVSNKLIERRARTDESITANTEDIEQAVEQGKNVVQAMLGYSREGTAPLEPFILAELVEDVLALLSKQFLTGITLTLDLDRSGMMAALPRARIEQLLLNLIVNASEAMDGHGQLAIVIRTAAHPSGPRILEPAPAPAYAELIVADSGAGIAPEVLPRIFEPFFTTKTIGANRGTGLGLSMVYTIARDCGLGIHVEAQPGRGAHFVIVFPKVPRLASRPADPARDSHTPEPAKPPVQSEG